MYLYWAIMSHFSARGCFFVTFDACPFPVNSPRHCWLNGLAAQPIFNLNRLTLLTIGSTRTYSPLGGAIWPPSQKIPGTCRLGLKHGRVSKEGLNITLKPKKVPSMVIGMSQGHFKYVASDRVMSRFNRITIGFLLPVSDKPGIISHQIM